MEKLNNWAYGFTLNHEGAGVGTIYYAEKYFEREGIVNPASAEAYTDDEIKSIKDNAVKESKNYMKNIPANALVGMSVLNSDKVFWYDEENSNKILASSAPLVLNAENGNVSNTDNELLAKAM